jgi:hypothetical protein
MVGVSAESAVMGFLFFPTALEIKSALLKLRLDFVHFSFIVSWD